MSISRLLSFFAVVAAVSAQSKLASQAPLAAQSPAARSQLAPDSPGCVDSRALPKLPGCRVDNCDKTDSDRRDVIVREDGNGQAVTNAVEGDTQSVMYECVETANPKGIVEQAAAALRSAGFEVPYLFSDDEGALTAHKGEVWLTLESASHFYTLIETKLTGPDFESMNDAASMADAIEKYGHVPLYGIRFLTGRADIAPESVTVLRELAILLEDNPDWNVRVEGHTDSIGTREANTALSLRRAAAVAAYLSGRGIKKARVESVGMADSHPIAPNDTEANRAKNRRIEIARRPAQ